MQDTITRLVTTMPAGSGRANLFAALSAMADRLSSQTITSPGLVQGSTAALVKNGTAFYFTANGVLGKLAINTDMAALSGTVTNAKFNVYCFFIDSASALTSAMGTEGATLAAVKFPAIPAGKAMIGFITINPTGTGNFVGGTTSVVDGTVTPNVFYVNTLGAFDPTVLV